MTKRNVQHWRSRAAEALATAEVMRHEETKAILVAIAEGYYRMAELAEEHEAELAKITQPPVTKKPPDRTC